jgi:CheY-like chemotaxis protein
MLTEFLESCGHVVDTAPDGVTGLDRVLGLVPDAAFVDIGLPGLDGYQLAANVRAAAEGRGVYLVALTGYGRPEDRARALDAGFDAWIVKPVDPQQLERLLAQAPDRRRPPPPAV